MWAALGSVVAETKLGTILDVDKNTLGQQGWLEVMSLTDRITEEV